MQSLARAASDIEKSHVLFLAWTLLLVAASSGWLAEAGLTNREPFTQGMLNATQPAKWDATGKVMKRLEKTWLVPRLMCSLSRSLSSNRTRLDPSHQRCLAANNSYREYPQRT